MTDTFSPYNTDLSGFEARYQAQCHCGAIQYAVACEPLDAKLCHCTDCQTLHGAPMQWAAIFHKTDIRFLRGVDQLRHYHSNAEALPHSLPRKVSCAQCGTTTQCHQDRAEAKDVARRFLLVQRKLRF